MTLTYGQFQTKYGLQIEMEKQRVKEEKKKLLLLKQYGERMSPWEVVDGKKVYVGYSEEYLISKGKQRPFYEIGGKCNCETCCNGGCCDPRALCSCHITPFPPTSTSSSMRFKSPLSLTNGKTNYWIYSLPVLVLAVVLIGGRK